MPDKPHANRSIADYMEQRATDLGKSWRQVADDGGISYEALRLVRDGMSTNPRRITKRGIELGLRWEPGSVDAILNGGEPARLQETQTPAPDSEQAMNEVLALIERMTPDAKADLLTRIVRGAVGADSQDQERRQRGA